MEPTWNDMIYFAAFGDSTELLYTKYNFNYDKYALDYGLDPKNKVIVFKDFLKRNGTTYDKPYTVEPEYTQYFNPITADIIDYLMRYGYTIHPNYMHIKDPATYIPQEQLIAEQFDMIEYTDEQIQRLQDYFFTENCNHLINLFNRISPCILYSNTTRKGIKVIQVLVTPA